MIEYKIDIQDEGNNWCSMFYWIGLIYSHQSGESQWGVKSLHSCLQVPCYSWSAWCRALLIWWLFGPTSGEDGFFSWEREGQMCRLKGNTTCNSTGFYNQATGISWPCLTSSNCDMYNIFTYIYIYTHTPIAPHKAVTEVSKIVHSRRGELFWRMAEWIH